MDSNLYEMIFKRKSFHLFRNIGNEHIAKEELKDMPVIANVDFGHTSPILTIPLGGFAKIENGCFTIKG